MGAFRKRIQTQLESWRKKVLDRDGRFCQACGSSERLTAHHITPISKDPSRALDPQNGITLCLDCHREEHGHLPKEKPGKANRTGVRRCFECIKLKPERLWIERGGHAVCLECFYLYYMPKPRKD